MRSWLQTGSCLTSRQIMPSDHNSPQTPPMNETYQLRSCHRPILHTDKRGGQLPLQHCYAEVVDQDGQPVASISYDGPSGVSEAQNVTHSAAHCEIVRQITPPQWKNFKQQVYQNCHTDNYSLAKNNCCSCLDSVFEAEFGHHPENIQQARKQIESQRPNVILPQQA